MYQILIRQENTNHILFLTRHCMLCNICLKILWHAKQKLRYNIGKLKVTVQVLYFSFFIFVWPLLEKVKSNFKSQFHCLSSQIGDVSWKQQLRYIKKLQKIPNAFDEGGCSLSYFGNGIYFSNCKVFHWKNLSESCCQSMAPVVLFLSTTNHCFKVCIALCNTMTNYFTLFSISLLT